MPTLLIRTGEAGQEFRFEVRPGDAVLIGRRPDPTRIDWSSIPLPTGWLAELEKEGEGEPELASAKEPPPGPPRTTAPRRLRLLEIPSPRTSSNHLLVLAQAEQTLLVDLDSRNGSWLRLKPGKPCVLPDRDGIAVMLSTPKGHEPLSSRIPDAQWSRDIGYGQAVAKALSDWMAELQIGLDLVLHEPGRSVAQGFPLADGSSVELKQNRTLDVSTGDIAEKIRQYIHDQNARFTQLSRRVAGMVVESPVMRQLVIRVAEAAAAGRRLVLLGPTGVGKELLARSYHGYSACNGGPFVTVNCALLDKQLLYAQLFGARRGSFTGATANLTGLLEAADGGTLFLDELGEMPMEVQAALLRFLDTHGEYYSLGDTRPRRASVQVVCATNAALNEPRYRDGRFRNDLWYRLASVVLAVPPLATRREDTIGYLYLRKLAGGTLSVAECLSKEALGVILDEPWPGNFRELESFVERLPATQAAASISAEQCRSVLREGRPDGVIEPQAARGALGRPGYRDVLLELTQSNDELGWQPLVAEALRAFLSDHGRDRPDWHQLHQFVERYLKPCYVAHSAALLGVETSSGSLNYSALARHLHIADGKTVKAHLSRFSERFGTQEPDAELEKESGDLLQD